MGASRREKSSSKCRKHSSTAVDSKCSSIKNKRNGERAFFNDTPFKCLLWCRRLRWCANSRPTGGSLKLRPRRFDRFFYVELSLYLLFLISFSLFNTYVAAFRWLLPSFPQVTTVGAVRVLTRTCACRSRPLEKQVAGGGLLFVTGGLAAPALAAALVSAGVTGVAVSTLVSRGWVGLISAGVTGVAVTTLVSPCGGWWGWVGQGGVGRVD